MSAAQHFRYRAVDRGGQTVSGALDAPSRATALAALERQGLTPIDVSAASARLAPASAASPTGRRWSWRRQTLGAEELLVLMQSLAALLRAGVTVDRALQIAASIAPDPRSAALAADWGTAVRAGSRFCDALAAQAQSFPPYLLAMLEAGETSGALAESLHQAAELMQSQRLVRQRIRSALVYPAFLLGMVGVTLIVLLAVVLPRFESLFSESEVELPWVTRAVMATGRVIADDGVWFALVLAGLVWVALRLLRTPAGQRRWHAWTLKSRLTLGLPAAIETARALRAFATLLSSGAALPAALRVARGTIHNRVLADAWSEVAQQVKAGQGLSRALASARQFPPVVVQLARVGEETGQLEPMLANAASFLEQDSQATIERLLTLLVPVVTVAMGLLVAVLIGSVLIGLLSMNEIAV